MNQASLIRTVIYKPVPLNLYFDRAKTTLKCSLQTKQMRVLL